MVGRFRDSITEMGVACYFFLLPFLPFLKIKHSTMFNLAEGILLALFLFKFMPFKHKNSVLNIAHNTIQEDSLLCIFVVLIYSIYGLLMQEQIGDVISGTRIYLTYFLLFGVLCKENLKFNQNALSKLSIALKVSTVVLTVLGVVQFASPSTFLNLYGEHTNVVENLRYKSNFVPLHFYNRVLSLFLDPNIYGVALIFIYDCIKRLDIERKGTQRNTFIYFLIIVNIILSASRTAWVGFFVYQSCMVMFGAKNKRIKVLYVFMVCGIAISLYCFAMSGLFHYVSKMARMNNFIEGAGRFKKDIIFIEHFLDDPSIGAVLFGYGVNTARNLYQVFENSFFVLLYQFGLVGSVVFILTLCNLLYKLKIDAHGKVVLALFLLFNIVGDYFFIPQVTCYVVLILFMSCNYTTRGVIDNDTSFAHFI